MQVNNVSFLGDPGVYGNMKMYNTKKYKLQDENKPFSEKNPALLGGEDGKKKLEVRISNRDYVDILTKKLADEKVQINVGLFPADKLLSRVANLVQEFLKDRNIKLSVGPQYFRQKTDEKGNNLKEGSATGQATLGFIKDDFEFEDKYNIKYAIIGHSEAKRDLGENDDSINKKVIEALKSGVTPIICVGETKEQEEAKQTKQVVEEQVKAALKGVDVNKYASQIIIAYEPVYAIKQNPDDKPKQCSPETANEVCGFIKDTVKALQNRGTDLDKPDESGKEYGPKTQEHIRNTITTLYGGSVDETKAKGFAAESEIDGVLVGTASINAHAFGEIVSIFDKAKAGNILTEEQKKPYSNPEE